MYVRRRGAGDGQAAEGPHTLVGPFLRIGKLVRRELLYSGYVAFSSPDVAIGANITTIATS